MEYLTQAITNSLSLGAWLSPASQTYWGYLLTALLIGFTIQYFRCERSLAKACRTAFNPAIWLHRSALLDYKLVFVNHLIVAIVIGGGLLSVGTFSHFVVHLLTLAFGEIEAPLLHGSFEAAICSLVGLVSYDLGEYLQHRFQHTVPILWELHKVHHSAEVMTPLTAYRTHPLILVYKGVVVSIVSGTFFGILTYLDAGDLSFITLMGVNVLIVMQLTLGLYHLQHSHVWFVFPGMLRDHLISPAHHMIHHSSDPAHYNKNFGAVFTIWDRVGRTLFTPGPELNGTLSLGLTENEQRSFKTIRHLLVTPAPRIYLELRKIAAGL